MTEALLAFVFGLVIGSFLNVCIYRWPLDLSVVRPRSHCVACDAQIAWYDNIPLVSFALLGGRCRHCKARISWRYPVVELLTGALFFWFVKSYGVTPEAAKMCCFTAMLVALVFTDLEQRILPDEFTLGGTLLGLAFAPFVKVGDDATAMLLLLFGVDPGDRWLSVFEAAVGAALPAFFLWGGGWLYLKLRHKEGLGFGDVKLVAMVGSFLGFRGALLTLLLGSVSGSILGYGYIKLTGKDPSEYELPFGTFLGAAGLFAALTLHSWP